MNPGEMSTFQIHYTVFHTTFIFKRFCLMFELNRIDYLTIFAKNEPTFERNPWRGLFASLILPQGTAAYITIT